MLEYPFFNVLRASLHHHLLRLQQSNDACLLASQHYALDPSRPEVSATYKTYLCLLCPGSFGQGSTQKDFPRTAVRLNPCQINDVTLSTDMEHTIFEGVAWAVEQLMKI
jgi:hypothetical protein